MLQGQSQVGCAPQGSWSKAMILLADLSLPESQKDVVGTGRLFTAWWLMPFLGPKLPVISYLPASWLSRTCLSASGAINGNWLIPSSVFSRT